MHGSIGQARAAALASLLALALGAVGCGNSDDDGSNGSAQDNTAADTADTADAGQGSGGNSAGRSRTSAADRGGQTNSDAEIKEVLVGIQDDFVKVKGASYCDRLTAAGQRQVEEFGKAFGYGNDCVKVISTVAKNTRDAGVEQKPTKLISVKFKGDRAVATIRNGKRPRETMVFVNDQGDWKIPDPGFESDLGGDPK